MVVGYAVEHDSRIVVHVHTIEDKLVGKELLAIYQEEFPQAVIKTVDFTVVHSATDKIKAYSLNTGKPYVIKFED